MSTQQDSTLRRKVVAQTKIAFLWFIGRHPKRVKPVPDVVRTLYILVSSFCSMAAINAVLKFGPVFKSRNSPLLAPWAATIILTNNYLESPFGQPFPLAAGTLISAIIGTGLTKLFMLNPANEDHLWVCGVLSVTIASTVMGLTGTLHPAAAGTALLCSMSDEVRIHLGWFYLVNQLVLVCITVGIACLFGNMYAKYPLYWLLPPRLSSTKSSLPLPEWLQYSIDHLYHHEKAQLPSNNQPGLSSDSSSSFDISETDSCETSGSSANSEYHLKKQRTEESFTRDYGEFGDYMRSDPGSSDSEYSSDDEYDSDDDYSSEEDYSSDEEEDNDQHVNTNNLHHLVHQLTHQPTHPQR